MSQEWWQNKKAETKTHGARKSERRVSCPVQSRFLLERSCASEIGVPPFDLSTTPRRLCQECLLCVPLILSPPTPIHGTFTQISSRFKSYLPSRDSSSIRREFSVGGNQGRCAQRPAQCLAHKPLMFWAA